MLISCKAGNNTGHTHNLLRDKNVLNNSQSNSREVCCTKPQNFIRKHPLEKQINTHTSTVKPNSCNLHEGLCSNIATDPHQLITDPQLEMIISVGQPPKQLV